MDEYTDSMSKIALCLTGAQLAKDLMVQEFGIGEELAFNFFGWRENRLVMVAQLKREYMNFPVVKRLEACRMLCSAMTSHWAVDAVSFVAEGFETLNREKLDGRDLRQAFIEDENLVNECVTVTHCQKNEVNDDIELYLVSTPYKYLLGRDIEWGESMGYTRGTETVLRNSPIPKLLIDGLRTEIIESVTNEEFDETIATLTACGFNIEEM
jgi:hypothetical protein